MRKAHSIPQLAVAIKAIISVFNLFIVSTAQCAKKRYQKLLECLATSLKHVVAKRIIPPPSEQFNHCGLGLINGIHGKWEFAQSGSQATFR